MKPTVTGHPLEAGTMMGPMASAALRDELHGQVQNSIDAGAKVVLGGTPGVGAVYPPTVLTGVKPGMPAFEEELFGPAASVIKVKNEAEGIEIANDGTVFGL